MGLNKTEIKRLANILIYQQWQSFDLEQFVECEDLLTDEEQQKILDEIQSICKSKLAQFETKHNVELIHKASTREIVLEVLYEDE